MCNKVIIENGGMLEFIHMLVIGFLSKKIEKLDDAAFSNGNTFSHDVDSNIITFLSNDMGFNTVDLNNINLDGDNNFDEEDPKLLFTGT